MCLIQSSRAVVCICHVQHIFCYWLQWLKSDVVSTCLASILNGVIMLVLRDKDHTLAVQTPQAYPFLDYIYLTAFLSQRLCLFSISKEYFLLWNLRQDRRACCDNLMWEMCLNKASTVEPIVSTWAVFSMGDYRLLSMYMWAHLHMGEPGVPARALAWGSDAFHSATDKAWKLEQVTRSAYPFFVCVYKMGILIVIGLFWELNCNKMCIYACILLWTLHSRYRMTY